MRIYLSVVACTVSTTLASAAEMPTLPDALAIPKGQALLSVAANGTQNYECVLTPKGKLAWSFREPKADLSQSGKPIGRHFAGPTWEFADGTQVKGQVVASAPGKNAKDVPWLKLSVTAKVKKGPAAGVKYVLRTDTQGGVVTGDCATAKEMRAEPYQATYVFVK